MVIGWAINSAMIILAASTFFKQNIAVDELDQAQQLLVPLVGNNAGVIFAAALLLAGISSTITSGIAGASIFAGFYGEAYNHTDLHSKLGVLLSFVPALAIIFLIGDPFKGLILSQMLLSVQLPITVFTQVPLTSSKKVMGVTRTAALRPSSSCCWEHDGNRPKYSPAHQPILKEIATFAPFEEKTINF